MSFETRTPPYSNSNILEIGVVVQSLTEGTGTVSGIHACSGDPWGLDLKDALADPDVDPLLFDVEQNEKIMTQLQPAEYALTVMSAANQPLTRSAGEAVCTMNPPSVSPDFVGASCQTTHADEIKISWDLAR
jgi:hypothetical protein